MKNTKLSTYATLSVLSFVLAIVASYLWATNFLGAETIFLAAYVVLGLVFVGTTAQVCTIAERKEIHEKRDVDVNEISNFHGHYAA